ncbi:MAG: DEAD/DEAH box helicase [Spirochaetia bacterium]|nr:DEAD/DEAH box helicase [Spirochaetia bacterium]
MTDQSFQESDFLTNYSLSQQKIILNQSSVKQVIAAAGSGKTRTVTGLINFRILSKTYPPEKILMLSFSRKAVQELKERIPESFRERLEISTFHAFAYRWLSRIHPELSSGEIKILKEEDRLIFFQKYFQEHADAVGGIPYRLLLSDKKLFKELHPEIYKSSFKKFSEYKKANQYLEYGDLIRILVNDLIAGKPYVDSLRSSYDLIVVDEFQDTDPQQLDFLKEMKCRELVVVGDDWQAIYAFRGASAEPFMNFTKQFRHTKVFYLSDNYRSLPEIIKLGNHVIQFSNRQLKKKVCAARKEKKRNAVFAVPLLPGSERFIHEQFPREFSFRILTRSNRRRLSWIDSGLPDQSVMTIHKSKGLEFNCVFLDITGGWSGYSPDQKNHPGADEEIRIAYVGLTRAVNKLVIFYDPDAPLDRSQGALFGNVFRPKVKCIKLCQLKELLAS